MLSHVIGENRRDEGFIWPYRVPDWYCIIVVDMEMLVVFFAMLLLIGKKKLELKLIYVHYNGI